MKYLMFKLEMAIKDNNETRILTLIDALIAEYTNELMIEFADEIKKEYRFTTKTKAEILKEVLLQL